MSSGNNGIFGQIAGVIVGAVVLYFTDNYQAAFAAYSVTAGVSTLLLAGKAKAVNGPQLTDLSVQLSQEGTVLPWVFGRMRVAGNIVWGTQKIPHEHHSGGGKGSAGPSTTTTTYTQSVAIDFCRGVMSGYGRVWMDKNLMIDFRDSAAAATIIASDDIAASIRFYPGSSSQNPDPLIVSYEGPGNSTARLDICNMVFEDIQIDQFGERIPNIEVELFGGGSTSVTNQNLCSLTSADPGSINIRGSSWITADLIYLWRYDSPFSSNTIYLFRSRDGMEKEYIGLKNWPQVAEFNNTAYNPVNSREQFLVESVEILGGITGPQTLLIVDGLTGVIVRRCDLHVLTGDDSYLADAEDRMAAWDDATQCAAFGIRIGVDSFYRYRVTIFSGAGVESAHCDLPSGGVLCGLAAINGLIYAMVNETDGHMHLLTINQPDGVLISDFDGPAYAYDAGEITDCLQSDGATCWAYSNFNVWKWDAAGNVTILCGGGAASFKNDSGFPSDPLGGQKLEINDRFIIFQSEVLANSDSLHPIFRHQLLQYAAQSQADVTLASIVQSICDSVGVTCDVAELDEIMVSGFVVTRQMSAVEALNYLAAIYYFDGVPHGATLYFKLRGGSSVMTISTDDLAAHDFGADSPDALTEDRDKEIDVPQTFSVNFTNIDNDYQQGSVPALRLNAYSQQVATLDATAVAMTTTQAIQLAETAKITSWIERTKNTFSGDYRLKALQFADVVTIDDGVTLRRRRVTKTTDQQGLMQFECVADDASAYSSPRTSSGSQSSSVVFRPPATDFLLLDIPILRDADNTLGGYAAVDAGPSWPGVSVQDSDDDEIFVTEAVLTTKTIIGFATGALGDFEDGNVFDHRSSVTVNVGADTLSSYSQSVVLAGNAPGYLIGNEIGCACTATLVSTGVYRLTDWLRGLRGTEAAKATHVAGERFVVLQPSGVGLRKLTEDVGKLNVPRHWRAVTLGRSPSALDETTFTDTGRSMKPFAPVDLHVDRSTTPPTLSWHRRSRLSGRFLAAGVEPALGETQEKYEVDIESGGTLLETLTTFVPSVALAGSTAGNTATVYPISSVVGRGQGSSVTI